MSEIYSHIEEANKKIFFEFTEDFILKFLTILIHISDISDKKTVVLETFDNVTKWLNCSSDPYVRNILVKLKLMKCSFLIQILKESESFIQSPYFKMLRQEAAIVQDYI